MASGGSALVALIGAYEPDAGPGGLRALTPLAGISLVEHQVRRAIAAGAERAVLLIESLPQELADVIAALRRDGIAVAPVQGLDAAADAIPHDARVLLVADAALPTEPVLDALADGGVPAVGTVADTEAHADYERIDADSRWAGVALLDGRRVAETAAMLGSWDPVSTLLRRIVQEGAVRVAAGPAAPRLLVGEPARSAAERDLIEAAAPSRVDWPGWLLAAPLEERVVPALVARRIEAMSLHLGSAALAAAALLSAALDWRAAALVALVLAGLVAALGQRLARVQDRAARLPLLGGPLRRGAAAGATLLLGWHLFRGTGQWGWALVAALVVVAMLALAGERRSARGAQPLWLASVDALVWCMIPFALLRRWDVGLVLDALYAGASFAWVQRSVWTAREA